MNLIAIETTINLSQQPRIEHTDRGPNPFLSKLDADVI